MAFTGRLHTGAPWRDVPGSYGKRNSIYRRFRHWSDAVIWEASSVKPVKLTIELTPAPHRNLVAYGEALGRQFGQPPVEPARLVGPMIALFIATGRGFAKARKSKGDTVPGPKD
jgi:hypothetical protein